MTENDRPISLPSLAFKLELFPARAGTITLFEDVMNVAVIKGMLINKELHDAVMLSPKMLVSPFQILVAVNKALHVHATGHAKTKTVHSEIIYGLSPSSNTISTSLFRLGGWIGQKSTPRVLGRSQQRSQPNASECDLLYCTGRTDRRTRGDWIGVY